jgi:hypothetical protein
MFYKKENGKWLTGLIIELPKLTKENKDSLNGWKWHDEPPQEYLDWKEQQILMK